MKEQKKTVKIPISLWRSLKEISTKDEITIYAVIQRLLDDSKK